MTQAFQQLFKVIKIYADGDSPSESIKRYLIHKNVFSNAKISYCYLIFSRPRQKSSAKTMLISTNYQLSLSFVWKMQIYCIHKLVIFEYWNIKHPLKYFIAIFFKSKLTLMCWKQLKDLFQIKYFDFICRWKTPLLENWKYFPKKIVWIVVFLSKVHNDEEMLLFHWFEDHWSYTCLHWINSMWNLHGGIIVWFGKIYRWFRCVRP